MSTQQLIESLTEEALKSDLPRMDIGDTINVHVRIVEGEKERVQIFVGTVRDVVPILGILALFQVFVLRAPLPNPDRMLKGFGLVLAGLVFFFIGLELAIFPVGRSMAFQLTSPELIDINSGAGSSSPSDLTVNGNVLFLVADNGASGSPRGPIITSTSR